MEHVLGPLIGVGLLVYIDDVLIYADTLKQLNNIISAVLKLFAEAGLMCKITCCSLLAERMHFLGREMSKNITFPDSAKLEKI